MSTLFQFLKHRFTNYVVDVSEFIEKLPNSTFFNNLHYQISKSVSSSLLNFTESSGASSTKDFINKIHIALKELKETKAILEIILIRTTEKHQQKCAELIEEGDELCAILYSSITTVRNK